MTQHTEGNLTGLRNLKLYYQGWLPQGEPKAVLLIVHGVAEHGGRYARHAEYFTERGYAVYTMDLPGHGKSRGPPLLRTPLLGVRA